MSKNPGAVKYDQDKAPVFQGAVSYFPNAIEAVADVSGFGAAKYAWGGWRHVDGWEYRYRNALMRHFFADAKGEILDPESQRRHLAHVAWNALALLEKEITSGIVGGEGEAKVTTEAEGSGQAETFSKEDLTFAKKYRGLLQG